MLRTIKLLALAPLFALTLAAQTYTPKSIRFEGADDQDPAQLLTVTGWTAGKPLTKQEIEAGLQKLADTGSFSGISYTVNSTALVVKLEGGSGNLQLPVRFVNFAWWPADDLEHMVETNVPLYHGELSLTGTLTQAVEANLVAIAKQKGLTINVIAAKGVDPFEHRPAIALSIEHPEIVTGDIKIPDASPAFGPTTADFRKGMNGQEFDLVITSGTIEKDGADIYRNSGYLDATVDPPVYATPRKTATGYAVDATAEVHLGDRYHVASLQFNSPPPIAEPDLRSRAELKKGDPASPMGLLITSQKFSYAYQDQGYLDAASTTSTSLDNLAHTAAYGIEVRPGELYHLAAVDASAAPAQLQSLLARDERLRPGVAADHRVREAISEAVRQLNLVKSVSMSLRPDRAAHTVTFVLTPAGVPPHK